MVCKCYIAQADCNSVVNVLNCLHGLQVNPPNPYGLGDGSLWNLLDTAAWQAKQLANKLLVEYSNCSTLVLANVTLSNNTAQGAGGSLFVNSPQGFYNFCPENFASGAAHSQQAAND